MEIGLVRFTPHGKIGQLGMLINPERSIPFEASRIHGLYDVDVELAPRFQEIVHLLKAFIHELPLFVYNEDFDMGFLNFQLRQLKFQPIENPVIDVLKLARKLLEKERMRMNLTKVASYLGITVQRSRAHRAVYDAYLTGEVFRKFIPLLEAQSVFTFSDLLIYLGKSEERFQQWIHDITRAILSRKIVEIVYIDMNGVETTRRIVPKQIDHRNNEYFLLAYCLERKDERVFKFSRIRQWKPTPENLDDF